MLHVDTVYPVLVRRTFNVGNKWFYGITRCGWAFSTSLHQLCERAFIRVKIILDENRERIFPRKKAKRQHASAQSTVQEFFFFLEIKPVSWTIPWKLLNLWWMDGWSFLMWAVHGAEVDHSPREHIIKHKCCEQLEEFFQTLFRMKRRLSVTSLDFMLLSGCDCSSCCCCCSRLTCREAVTVHEGSTSFWCHQTYFLTPFLLGFSKFNI